ncbi:MAG: sigma-70 family RNA polymerase sigma factor [Sphingomonadales bacterium]|nr:sigma-70 family RNA polymerase sigma factor [Sphingomonadales bacterium]
MNKERCGRRVNAIKPFYRKQEANAVLADLRGDASLDDIYRAYFRPLSAAIAKAFGQGPPEPEEVVHTAFLKFIGLKDRGKVKNARAFLYTTARNIVIDDKRRIRRNDSYVAAQLAYDSEFELEEITPERVLREKERFAVVAAAMKKLPRKQQVVLTMNRLQGKSYSEIIRETGWSLGDISRNLNAGKQTLMDALEAAESIGPRPRDGG